MRGGLIVSEAPGLFGLVCRALATTGAVVSDDGEYVQVDGESPSSALLYRAEDEWRIPPLQILDGSPHLDLNRLDGVMLECSSPARVAELTHLVGQIAPAPVWFLDAADVAWESASVDVTRVTL